MNINRRELASLGPREREALTQRIQQSVSTDALAAVSEIVEEVRLSGDTALLRHTERLDGCQLTANELRLSSDEIAEGAATVPEPLRAAIATAVQNIEAHHHQQMPSRMEWRHSSRPGLTTGERWTPIDSAGLYVPRGKGSFPSVMAMLAVPALIAKVPRIAVCTPPGPSGSVDAACLFLAQELGLSEIYRIGGAQAIAALAYGTKSVAPIAKVIGPGNQYVTAAKRLVWGVIDPGPPAGPSESIVLADDSCNPLTAALELLVEAEHGSDSAALLVCASTELADAVEAVLPSLVSQLPEPRRSFCEEVMQRFGGIVVAESSADAIDFVNEFAPEHLHVLTSHPDDALQQIRNAGEILLGPHTSIAYGNYAVGVNAILPTGGFAKSYSAVGVHDFLKRSSFAHATVQAAGELVTVAEALALHEGFPAHARAARAAADPR